MSRIRTTLDSVTKAVGSTDLISKFSRLKPGSASVDSAHAEKALVKAETLTSNNTATASPHETTMKEEEEEGERSTAEEESDKQQVPENPFVATKKSTSSLASAASVSGSSSSSTVAKQTVQLFHPAALSTNMDEIYKTLAQHINSYFGSSMQEEGDNRPCKQQHREGDDSEPTLSAIDQKSKDHIPILSPVAEAKSIDAPTTSPPSPSPSPSEKLTPPAGMPSSDTPAAESAAQSIPAPATSPKKGFTHYLSYPRPSVQAFVGSYIAPLVPKFRGDSKSIAAEKDKSPAVAGEEVPVEKAEEKTEEDKKADKVKEQLLTQREKVRRSLSTALMNFECSQQLK